MNKIYFLLFFTSSLLFSCSSDVGNFRIGEDLVDAKSGIVITDSFTVKLSTILLDSIPTSNTEQILVGKYTSAVSGSLEMNSYFNFDMSETVSSLDDEEVFDSLTIELNYSGYHLGDTTLMQELKLYRLTESLELIEDDASQEYLFNNSSFPHEADPMGQLSFIPRPGRDSIEFRLSDALGLELMELVRTDAQAMESNEKFNDYLKGFVLKSAAESQSIIGFTGDTSGIKLNLYTHLPELEKTEKKHIYYLAAEGTHFNQAITDRSATPFSVLNNQREELPSVNSNNRTYIQGSAGVVTRVDFPTLNEIFSLDDRVMIRAELIFVPSVENDMRFIPRSLQFYTTDRINRIGDNLTVTSSSQQVSVQAVLIEDKLYPENSYYIADISQHLTSQLAGNFYDTNNGLMLSIPFSDLQTTAGLLILNGEKTSRYRPLLKLYFLRYE
ncbi:MAG: DUF4270 family protein [Prolixibacteraceae bacterium]